jgi:uncharacterized delta-60 repeat protein
MCTVRYNANGSLDTTFDVDGRATTATAPGAGTDTGRGVVIRPSGGVVIAGDCAMGGATGQDLCAVQYLANGSLDPSFDGDGRVTVAVAPGAGTDALHSMVVQQDGRVVVGGHCNMGGATGTDGCLARLNADGSLDASFDGDGRVTTDIGPGVASDQMYGLTGLADGRLLMVGRCDSAGVTALDGCLARYAPGGLIDQYNDGGGDDWDSVGSSIGLFGACLSATTLSTPTWTVNASCPTDDGAFWQPVPTTASAVATANPLTSTATATIRFGVRVADDYPTGDYIAPVTFSVSAP